jgi:hypothetical protein
MILKRRGRKKIEHVGKINKKKIWLKEYFCTNQNG